MRLLRSPTIVVSVAIAVVSVAVGFDNVDARGLALAPDAGWRVVYQWVTMQAVHESVGHLVQNLIALVLAGVYAERAIGLRVVSLMYLAAAAGGALASRAEAPFSFAVGASGLAFGALGAAGIASLHKAWSERRWSHLWMTGLVGLIAAPHLASVDSALALGFLEVSIGSGAPDVSLLAHVAGFIIGAAVAVGAVSRWTRWPVVWAAGGVVALVVGSLVVRPWGVRDSTISARQVEICLDGESPSVCAAMRDLLRWHCENGDPTGCHVLGFIEDKGLVEEADAEAAARWYRLGCSGGVDESCHNLGLVMAEGRLGSPDPERAVELFGDACGNGLARSCVPAIRIALRVDDAKRARRFARQGCERYGHEMSCAHFADFLARGQGGPKDEALATSLVAKGCAEGSPTMCTGLGAKLHRDAETEAERMQALEILDEQCDGGHEPACGVANELRTATGTSVER